jgi:nucleoside-diphosphate-sugar epimerase
VAAEFVPIDVREPATLRPALEGVSCVIHAAGLAHVRDRGAAASADFRGINELGTANVALAAAQAGVRHIVLVSSVAVYGDNPGGARDESAPCVPLTPYALSKWHGEQRAARAVAGTATSLTVLRLATVYGEEDPGNVAVLMRAIDRRRFVWIGRGNNLKTIIHREDAAQACLLAARDRRDGTRVFNVAAIPCPMAEIVAGFAVALGRRVPRVRVPAAAALSAARVLAAISGRRWQPDQAVRKWLADDAYRSDEIRRELGFEARVSLGDGLRREVAWYRNLCT